MIMTKPRYTWSFSSLGMFNSCPRRYWAVRVAKVVTEPQGQAASDGTRIHTKIENYLKDGKFDEELIPYTRILNVYKELNGECEVGYHFTEDWKPCAADDPNVWVRSYIDWRKLDLEKGVGEVTDWKTGRVKVTKQLSFYAYLVFKAHPEIEDVKSSFQFLKYKDQIIEWYHRRNMEKLYEPFHETLCRLDVCLVNDLWPETPGEPNKYTGRGNNCTFCWVTQEHCSNGLPLGGEDGNKVS